MKIPEEVLEMIRLAGGLSYPAGKAFSDNPYCRIHMRICHEAWRQGFSEMKLFVQKGEGDQEHFKEIYAIHSSDSVVVMDPARRKKNAHPQS